MKKLILTIAILILTITFSIAQNHCLVFDGIDDYVGIPNHSSLNFGTGDFTIEAWIVNNNTPGSIWKRIFIKRGLTSQRWYALCLQTNKLTLELAGNSRLIAGPAIQGDGRWHHVAAVRTGTSIHLYIDGIKYSATNPNYAFNTDNIYMAEIGSWGSEAYGGEKWIGKIDEIRVWNDARTDEEIRENIHRELLNPSGEANLVAYYQFNQTSGTILPDLSSSGNNGTLVNMDPATDWISSTAPIPFKSVQNGYYIFPSTWADGQFYPVNAWSRVSINHDVVVDEPVEAIDITVEDGGIFNIGTTPAAVEVTGDLVNNAGPGGIFMQSSAAGHGSLIENDGAEATIQRYFSGNDIDWHLVSSPVSNAQSEVFTGMYLQQFNESTGLYTEVIPSGMALNPTQGYGLYSNLSNSNTVNFTGNLNAGSHTVVVTANNPYGWNLVGNPFSSSIDWNAVIPTLSSNIGNSIYYLEAGTGNWLTWNGTTGSGSRYIPPMQGFFVSASNGELLTFDNSMRTRMGSGNFYKEDISDLLVIKAEGNGFEDKTYIHFNESATQDFDGQFDGYKIISDKNPQLPQVYTRSGENKLSINYLPTAESMALGFESSTSGNYTFSIDEVNDFTKVLLEDLETGIITDMFESSYEFSYEAGNTSNRFVLHFTTLGVENIENNIHTVYSSGNTVYVNSSSIEGFIEVFALDGKRISTSDLDKSGFTTLKLNTLTGFYLVKVTTNESVMTEKVIIKN